MPAAAVVQDSNYAPVDRKFAASAAATLVNTSLDVTLDVSWVDRVFVLLTVATAALTGFAIKASPAPGVAPSILYSSSTDFTSPKGLLVGASGDLTTQAVGTGWFVLDVAGLDSITLTATSAGAATLAVQAGGA